MEKVTRQGKLGLGQLLLALDRTMVSLIEAPLGLDMPVGSVALVDVDDVRLGLAVGAGNADLFFLLGVSDDDAVRWLDGQTRVPVAIFVSQRISTQTYRSVLSVMAAIRIRTSNSSSKKSGR